MARSHIVDLAGGESQPAPPDEDELAQAAAALWWGISIAAVLMALALIWS